ncbi:MAG TPA: nucleotide pyrophosphatase/phosphodiesterase family protein [Candidatus Limnocylindrales bacterium]|nr:nucleotide pyrophosphatase/phosphodiesterase family protein [Candidatus Limnocylindrales bacterium]
MITPDYQAGTLADVIPGALAALGLPGMTDRLGLTARLEGVSKVAVLLIDGMGYHQLPLMGPYISTIPARRITCGFPSTTPTSLVSLATGVPPGSHGILSFFAAVPGTDMVISHAVWKDYPIPEVWQPVPTLYLAAQEFSPVIVNRPEYVGSGLTEVTTRGTDYRGACGVDEVASGVLRALTGTHKIVYGYHPELDKAGHSYGVDSDEWRFAASEVDRLVSTVAQRLPRDAALIVTADHGQLNVPADHRINLDDYLDGIRVIAGEPRVRYLHTLPGATRDVLQAWRLIAGPAAWVGTREEAIEAGWYGPVDRAFVDRIGEVVMVCQDDWALLTPTFDPPTVSRLVAMHGAMTEVEMAIPLIVIRPS